MDRHPCILVSMYLVNVFQFNVVILLSLIKVFQQFNVDAVLYKCDTSFQQGKCSVLISPATRGHLE